MQLLLSEIRSQSIVWVSSSFCYHLENFTSLWPPHYIGYIPGDLDPHLYTHIELFKKEDTTIQYPYRSAQNQANSFNFDLNFVKQQQKKTHDTHR